MSIIHWFHFISFHIISFMRKYEELLLNLEIKWIKQNRCWTHRSQNPSEVLKDKIWLLEIYKIYTCIVKPPNHNRTNRLLSSPGVGQSSFKLRWGDGEAWAIVVRISRTGMQIDLLLVLGLNMLLQPWLLELLLRHLVLVELRHLLLLDLLRSSTTCVGSPHVRCTYVPRQRLFGSGGSQL